MEEIRRKGLAKDACGKCKEACLKGAIDYDTEKETEEKVEEVLDAPSC